MDENKKTWIKRIAILVLDLVLAGAISYSRYQNPPAGLETVSVFHALSDGFIVIGFLNFAFGVLVWISSTGFFDIFSFAFRSFLNFFVPRSILEDKGTYYEYKVKKAEKRKERIIFKNLIVIGVAMIALAILFNILVYV